MIGRLVTAVAGQALARTIGGAAAGPLGAVVGLALPAIARRAGPWGMAGLAIGAWAVGRMANKPRPPAERAPVVTPPPIAMAVPADGY